MVPPCTAALARRARIASQARASAVKTAPCTTSDSGWRTPSRIAPERTTVIPATGSRAASHARRTGRWDSVLPTSPATIPDSHGSTSSGPSPSTGGSVVSRSFQPKSSWSVSRPRVCGVGATAPSARRQSGPPRRKKASTASSTGATAGHRSRLVTWTRTIPTSTPAMPTTAKPEPVYVGASPSSAAPHRASRKPASTSSAGDGRQRPDVRAPRRRPGVGAGALTGRSSGAGRPGLPWRRPGAPAARRPRPPGWCRRGRRARRSGAPRAGTTPPRGGRCRSPWRCR